mmetsp:Transcript_63472/g.112867  ORF Transcript_63472/g.112867 Transcript_63472/m.112867 type:complete len:283 (-) Transcript_63472:102-950(-)|eukprot:CAMPEP_0197662518 /NCGR_PEP_ID=MMETSP1338-20131121/53745_1 /TAXON_ID=43686 ORGANISM="Pelagodinium beii, Strain RCC1491" /NCGR_SAMPLE_ID=MMETSP1338 /ASSEMBLY_ACC=CAM_ASM_000754 /LENGTH=282 /DNA_ID=CAMNT_0043240405 /DNA_START=49 /DNA_END=897 /DNA_ORIENTATION=+
MAVVENAAVVKVPPEFILHLKDLDNVRVQGDDNDTWIRPKESVKHSLKAYLWEHSKDKSWKATESRRMGFNKSGVFVHEDHVKRYFGLLRSAARRDLTAAAPEPVPVVQNFNGNGKLIKLVETKMDTVTDEMRTKVLKSTFQAADTNKDGYLSKPELGTLMRRMVLSISPDDIELMMKEADQNGDKQIDFAEFVDWTINHQSGMISEKIKEELGSSSDIVRASFRAWDRNGDGSISKAEVRKVLMTSCNMPAKDADVLAQILDTDGNGSIDYDEFVEFLYPR